MSSCHGCNHHYHPAPTYQEVVSAIIIHHKKEAPKELYRTEGNIEFVQIGEKVVLELPSVSKAIESWERYKTSCQNWRVVWGLLGLGAGVLGVWRGWATRSLIWTMGGSVVAYLCHRHAYKLHHNVGKSSKAVSELTTMIDQEGKQFSAKLIFKTFREDLLRDGLEKFEEHRRSIPPAYPKNLLALFTQEELKGLLNRWIENIRKLSAVERGRLLQTHDFFETAIPKAYPHRHAAHRCNLFIQYVKQPEMKKNVVIYRKEVVDEMTKVMKQCLGDHQQFKKLFEERFDKEFKDFECTNEMLQEGIGKFFETRLTLFANSPEQFSLNMRCNTDEQEDRMLRDFCGIIFANHLREVFARICNLDGMDNGIEYQQWVYQQLAKTPHEYPNRDLLLSFIPKN